MTTAFLFPGQGSQRVGMGLDLLDQHPELMSFYTEADRLLGIPLSTLCLQGPARDLRRTEITQPAVFLTSLLMLEVLRQQGIRPDLVAGHSLGEYTALVAAGVLAWQDALRLVRRRGELMAEAGRRTPGAMVAVIGLDVGTLDVLCRRATRDLGGVAEIANDNDPEQLVVSGSIGPVTRLAVLARAAGARTVPLEVSAPFHCSLMREVEPEVASLLDGMTLSAPSIPVVANVDAGVIHTAARAALCLRRQISGRVRWTESLRMLAALGADRFVEVGPGRVLQGTCRATLPQLPAHATGDARRLARTVEALRRESSPVGATAG